MREKQLTVASSRKKKMCKPTALIIVALFLNLIVAASEASNRRLQRRQDSELPVFEDGSGPQSDQQGTPTQIINGEDANDGDFPWFALLKIYSGCDGSASLCGGSLIGQSTVLTAAHCLIGASRVEAWVGATSRLGLDSDPYTAGSDCLILHPGYDSVAKVNDIALIMLDRPAPLQNVISIDNRSESELCPGGSCVDARVAGFGSTIYRASSSLTGSVYLPTTLQVANVSLLNYTSCRNQMEQFCNDQPSNWGGDNCTLWSVTPRSDATMQVCTADGSGDSCQGDSGGPLFTEANGRWLLVGAVQWGYGCGGETPAVYTYVKAYTSWIAAVIAVGCKIIPPTVPLSCGTTTQGNTNDTDVSFVGGSAPEVLHWFEVNTPGVYVFDACSNDSTADVSLGVYPVEENSRIGQPIATIDGTGCESGSMGATAQLMLTPGHFVVSVESLDELSTSYELTIDCGGLDGDACKDELAANISTFGGRECSYWVGRNCEAASGSFYGLSDAEEVALTQSCPFSCGLCANAALTIGETVWGTTCGQQDAVFVLDISVGSNVEFSTCGSHFDTIISIENTAGGVIANNDDHNGGCSSDVLSTNSYLAVGLNPGNYSVEISGYNAAEGPFVLASKLIGLMPTAAPISAPTVSPSVPCEFGYSISSTRSTGAGRLQQLVVAGMQSCTASCSTNDFCSVLRYNPSDGTCTLYQGTSRTTYCNDGQICCQRNTVAPTVAPSEVPTTLHDLVCRLSRPFCRRGSRPLVSRADPAAQPATATAFAGSESELISSTSSSEVSRAAKPEVNPKIKKGVHLP